MEPSRLLSIELLQDSLNLAFQGTKIRKEEKISSPKVIHPVGLNVS